MTAVTIKNGAGVTFTFADGEVDTVRSAINADIDQTPLPTSAPSQAFLFDFEGVRKIITVKGSLFDNGANRISSGTAITILAQKQFLEKALDGLQTAVDFTSTYESQTFDGTSFVSTKVMWGTIAFDEIAGDVEVLPFTMTLVVGL